MRIWSSSLSRASYYIKAEQDTVLYSFILQVKPKKVVRPKPELPGCFLRPCIAKTVEGVCYFVFNDCQLVYMLCYKCISQKHPDNLHARRISSLLPAYNQYNMGGVHNTGWLQKTYGYDRKCRRYCFRLLFYCVDVAVNNDYILYEHNCKRMKVKLQVLKNFF